MKPSTEVMNKGREIVAQLNITYQYGLISKAINKNKGLNYIRHNLTNYDNLTIVINSMGLEQITNDAAIHVLQNKINNNIDFLRINHIEAIANAAANEVAVLANQVSQLSLEVEYMATFDMSASAAKLLATSKVENARLKAIAKANKASLV